MPRGSLFYYQDLLSRFVFHLPINSTVQRKLGYTFFYIPECHAFAFIPCLHSKNKMKQKPTKTKQNKKTDLKGFLPLPHFNTK